MENWAVIFVVKKYVCLSALQFFIDRVEPRPPSAYTTFGGSIPTWSKCGKIGCVNKNPNW